MTSWRCPDCVNETWISAAADTDGNRQPLIDAINWHIGRVHTQPVDSPVDKVDGVAEPTDDKAIALQAAATALGPLIGQPGVLLGLRGCDSDVAGFVTEVAEKFVAWLRELDKVSLELVAIEDEGTGEVIAPGNGGTMALILTGQRARAVINAEDSRGFPVDATLAVTVTDAAGGASNVATAEIVEATSGTASGKDELLVHVGTEAGSALVKVYAPDKPDTVFGSLAVDVAGNPDDVAHIDLSTAVIEDEPAAPPVP